MLRRLFLVLGGAVGLAIVAVLAGWAWFQTDTGRAWLAASLSSALSSPDSRISINELSGTVPSSLRVARIELADSSGVWLQIDNAAVELRLRDLLARQLTIRELSADRIAVFRSPEGGTSPPPQQSEPFSLPSLPVKVVVDRFAAERIDLSQALLGEPAVLRLSGAANLLRDEARAAVAVQRLDAAGDLRLDVRFERDRTLAVHLDAAEPSGKVLQHMLGHPETLPLTIAVHGEGPLAAWRGEVRVAAGDATVDATIALTERDGLHIAADGRAAIRPLLPSPARDLLAQPITFALAALVSDERLSLERLALDGAVARIEATGALDRRKNAIAGAATVTAAELQPLGAAFDLKLAGSARAELKVDGTLDAPMLDLVVQGDRLDGTIRADRIAARLRAAREPAAWAVQGSGDAAGMVWPGPEGLPDTFAWTLDGKIADGPTHVALERVTLQAPGAALVASGALDIAGTPQGRGTIELKADDLAQWRAAAGLPLSGQLTLGADIALAADGISAKISGRTADLSTGDARLDALLGPRVDLKATTTRTAAGALALDDLVITGANLTLAGGGRSAADLSALDARLRLDAPRLAVLADALGTPVDGAVTLQAQLDGAIDEPRARVDLSGDRLRFGEQRVDRLNATLALADARAPRGTLAATVKAGALDAALNAAFARKDENVIDVSQLALRAPGSEFSGALAVRTDRPAATGTLTLRAGNLSPWSTLAGTALAGSADARIALAEKDGQRIDINATLRALRLDDLQASVKTARLETRLSDVFAKPAGRAALDVNGVDLPGLRIDGLRANGQSTRPELFALSLDMNGALRPTADAQALRLSAAGDIGLGAAEQRLRVNRLTARVGAHELASRAPLTIATGPGRLKVDGLDLTIDQGRITGSASREASRLALQTQIRNLPLELVQVALPAQKIAGRLDGTIRFAGTPAQPDGQAELTARDVRIAAAANLPPVTATTLGTWKGTRLDVVGQVAAPDGTKVDLRAAAPVRLDAETLTPVLIQDGPLSASVKGDGHLERWAPLLPLGEDRLSGRYAVDLAVGGTPAKPDPRGRLTISEGRYINFAAGTEISDLNVEIGGNGTRFALNRLSGRDGAKGTLEGSGSLDLAQGMAFDLATRFVNFGLMRRDDLSASGDGEIRIAGTPQAATVSGHLRVDRAEIRIPERLPPSIPRLPVVEIDSRSGAVLSTPEQGAGSSAIKLAVDVAIPARTFVRGRGLDSEWRGAVHVGGTTAAPQITGKLETVRGDFSLLGKRFTLGDSTITFIGGEKIDPQLGINAQHQTAAILALATITGTVSDPTIKLSSQPEMPQDEVLSRVLFGRSVTEMTPAQGLQLAQAAATLAGGGGPGILDRVRAATGLDRLDISSREPSAAGGPSGTTVTAGEYVSDRVFVGVEQGLKSDSTRPKVEVEITPNVTVESSVGSSSAGLGVNWKWDY